MLVIYNSKVYTLIPATGGFLGAFEFIYPVYGGKKGILCRGDMQNKLKYKKIMVKYTAPAVTHPLFPGPNRPSCLYNFMPECLVQHYHIL